jgi:hypothetical protein
MKNNIVTKFNFSGPCEIDILMLEKLWDYRFLISQYNDEYRLYQYLRRGSECTKIKCNISVEQAKEAIEKLDLVKLQDSSPVVFKWVKKNYNFRDMMRKNKSKTKI